MKKLNILLAFLLLGLSVNVFAQESNENDPAEPQSGRTIQQQRNVTMQNNEYGNSNNENSTEKKHLTWIGLNAGFGFTDVSGEYQKFLGLQLGVKAMHFHNKLFGFLFSIHYESFNFMSPDWSLFTITGENYKLEYISLELAAAIKISSFYAGAGIFYDFLLSAKSGDVSIKNYFNSGNYGALIDVGIILSNYYIGLKFKFGLGNIFNYYNSKEKSYAVYLTGGFGINL